MYSRGITTRDIEAHLHEIYGVEVSPTLVSEVTEAEVRTWRSRPLEPTYAIVYLDALYVKMRDNGQVQNRRLVGRIKEDRPLAIDRSPPCCFPQVGTESAPCYSFFRSSIARPTDTPIYAASETSPRRPQDSGPTWTRYAN
jgi:hypothetical protein